MGLLLSGCAESRDTEMDNAEGCSLAVWAKVGAGRELPSVVGAWDDWQGTIPMRRFDERWAVAQFAVPAGNYGYAIVDRGTTRVDPLAALGTFRARDGLEVSWIEVADCQSPRIVLESVRPTADGAELEVAFVPAESGAPLDPSSLHIEDGVVDVAAFDAASGSATLVATGIGQGKARLSVLAQDTDGVAAEPGRAALLVGALAPATMDAVVYQVMIDRYRAAADVALAEPPSPGARAGGTLGGIAAELEAGTFARLGVTTLWLSPVYTNPVEARLGVDGQLYEGYHGYWPLDSRGVDPRIGGEAALHNLVDAAHAEGIAVVLDLVPNHLYEANPRVPEFAARGWFHGPDCVCGTPSCPWDGNIERCWFTPYLADLDFVAPEVVDAVVDDALWWQRTFDVDGVRIDAVPMMPRVVSRRIVHALRQEAGHRAGTLSLGEVFTGAGPAGTEALRYFLGPDGLDSAFDFPLMWALRAVMTDEAQGFVLVEESLNYTRDALAGSSSVMSTMIGNHDVPRFISALAGEAGRSGWDGDVATQPGDASLYAKQSLALSLLLTLEGVPVLYYGDEVGLAGGADPDNRRVMPSTDALLPVQLELRDQVGRLGRLRRCLPALRHGDRTTLAVASEALAFVRDADDAGPAVVVARRAGTVDAISLGGAAPTGQFVDVLSGELFSLSPGAAVPVAAQSIRVLVPAEHGCVR